MIVACTAAQAASDPAGYVLSVNVRRRHLSKGQAAIAAAKLKEYYAREAKERMTAGINQHSPVKKFPQAEKGNARDKAGEQFGVSGKTVDDAEAVIKNGAPELVQKVASGEISVNQKARKDNPRENQ